MCGLAGIYNYNNEKLIDEHLLISMRDILAHRGPDGFGLFINGRIGLAHRRLSILDVSENGHQPFISQDGRFIMVFNGEIYNYLELRPELENDGINFKSNSDTEVLLYLYIKYGASMLEKLNGMFSFAIWDNQEQVLFIARDRLGIKPLYYSNLDGTFMFASEQKALLKAGISKAIDENELNELLLYRYVSGEKTLFKYISKLLPGHYMIVSKSIFKITRWWNLSEKIEISRSKKPSNVYQWLESTLATSLHYRMISDRPVGVLLSGGLDSSSIVATLSKCGYQNLSAFTVGFEEQTYNEGNLAKIVADKYNFNYHEIILSGNQVHQSLSEAAWFHDEPLIHQNDAHLLAVSKYAKKYVSVLLSGEASDELMGGYVRYKPLAYLPYKNFISPLAALLFKISPNPRYKKLIQFYKMKSMESVLVNSCSIYPHDLSGMGIQLQSQNEFNPYRLNIFNESRVIYPHDPIRQAMYLDQHTFLCSLLERNDKMTMGASIECRIPFLDYRLVEMIGAIPTSYLLKGKKGKYLLYNSIGKNLPEAIKKYKKNGFAVPWENYLKNNEHFKQELHEMKTNPFLQIGVLKNINIFDLIKRFENNDRLGTILLRQLLMIHMWYKNFYEKI
jgi:asparagine synthase (glutamine-hydrolysing)